MFKCKNEVSEEEKFQKKKLTENPRKMLFLLMHGKNCNSSYVGPWQDVLL